MHDSGRVLQQRDGFSNSFSICEGWQQEWAAAAAQADVALVVIGAWDVFDVEIDGTTYVFGTPEFDQLFTARAPIGHRRDGRGRRQGRACSRWRACVPRTSTVRASRRFPSAATTPGSPTSTSCMRGIAGADPANVTFVAGPAAWCNDETIATDLGHRWDGVHVYKPGAKLIYETIAPALLEIPA